MLGQLDCVHVQLSGTVNRLDKTIHENTIPVSVWSLPLQIEMYENG
jgi:hypothetical protein